MKSDSVGDALTPTIHLPTVLQTGEAIWNYAAHEAADYVPRKGLGELPEYHDGYTRGLLRVTGESTFELLQHLSVQSAERMIQYGMADAGSRADLEARGFDILGKFAAMVAADPTIVERPFPGRRPDIFPWESDLPMP